MGRPLESTILILGLILGVLALLGACIELPKPSLSLREAADRQTRYAAESALAVKEDRRDALSEAAANGRIVLPRTPEIWGPAPTGQKPGRTSLERQPARIGAGAAIGSAGIACGSTPVPPDDPWSAHCRPGWRGARLAMPPLGYATVAPAAASLDP